MGGFCTGCGRPMREGAGFCTSCGRPARPPAPFPGVPEGQPSPGVPAPPRRRGAGIAVAVVALVALLAVGGTAGFLLLRRGPLSAGGGAKLGVAEAKVPDRAALVGTEAWGEVPANQLGVVLREGAGSKVAEKVAKELGGSVVGRIEFIDAYQIEYPGRSEADLKGALARAKAVDGVDWAYPNGQVTQDAEIWGVRVNPYDDPSYGNGAGDGNKAIGVAKAWDYIKGAGIELGDVHVGIVDDGLYMPGDGAENEFEGSGVNVKFPDPDAGELGSRGTSKVKVGNEIKTVPNKAGSHGTGVATVIGADPDNGGPSGIAAPLGKKLTISMTNQYGGKYGDTTTTPDPDDPTKQVWHDGKSYSIGSLVAITKQVEAGATVINCSWGNSEADPLDAATYKKFFEKMAEKHPDVIFVCSGGNSNQALDGTRRYPSGLALPNMITVGSVDNAGNKSTFSCVNSANYEITLAAPGTDAVVGLADEGGPVRQSGTSFAAPQVAAAAAMLKALDPDLQAGDIKRILTETARTDVKRPNADGSKGFTSTAIPAGVGGRILAIDQAVLKVINDRRRAAGEPELEPERLEELGVIDAVAVTGKPNEYAVKGIVKATGRKGTGVRIEVFGENTAVGGKTTQQLSGGGEARWDVTLEKGTGTIKVTRLDNGAASVISIDKIAIGGTWNGTFTITEVTAPEGASDTEGCNFALLDAMKGKPMPARLDVTVDEAGTGSATMILDPSALGEEEGDVEAEPQTYNVTQSGTTVTFTPVESNGIHGMTATVGRSGQQLTMSGVLTGGGGGVTMKAVFELTKPDTGQ